MSRWKTLALLAGCMAAPLVHSQDTTASVGKQRAVTSPLEWDVQETTHPKLGAIRFAYLKHLIETSVGNAKVYSRMYLSCEKGRRRLAIELTNVTAPDDPGGLKPKTLPRLICTRLPLAGTTTPVREELLAPRWEVSPIGDVMARGLTSFPLRECVTIDVEQDVALPQGWAKPSLPVSFEIAPYSPELDQIFTACGEVSAYAPAVPPTVVAQSPPPTRGAPAKAAAKAPPPAPAPAPAPAKTATPAKAPPPVPARAPEPVVAQAPEPVVAKAPEAAPPKPAPSVDGAWQAARASANGKTNVRAKPTTDSALVTQLHPGMPVQVQKAENDWYRIRTNTGGTQIEGYIRQDRLSFK